MAAATSFVETSARRHFLLAPIKPEF